MNKNNRKEKKDNLNILKFIGPGLLVTVGFIDPGNWASNIAAGWREERFFPEFLINLMILRRKKPDRVF